MNGLKEAWIFWVNSFKDGALKREIMIPYVSFHL